jgi:transposase
MNQRKKTPRKHPRKARKNVACLNPQTHPDAAGIDIGAEEILVAVPAGRDPKAAVRTFSTFTDDIHALRDWLLECDIRTVAIESTGNYWITTYTVLEDAGIDVFLVNARHVKAVPGKKSDVYDCQWLQQLHAAGLLRKSFRPKTDIVCLRYLMRHRNDLIAQGGQQIQLMQKVLTEMNLHIHHVFSDVDGESAQRIISAILAGERDAEKLASLRDARCRSPREKILRALEGDYRPEYLFVLRQCQERWQQICHAVGQCDQQIATLTAAIAGETQEPCPTAPRLQRLVQKNTPLALPIYDEAWRFYGVDLSAVPGISSGVLCVLMSELGTASHIREAFPSVGAFTSWLGLCPDNRITGGRILRARTRKIVNRVSNILRLAAGALGRAAGKMGDYCRRMKGRLGKAEGITAVAHKLARIIYTMITTRKAYDESQAFQLHPVAAARRLKHLHNQAQALGLKLIPA